MTLGEFNALTYATAREALASCCGASRWITEMNARRPFATTENVFEAAEIVWNSLDVEDWLDAFHHHPRIGETRSAAPQADLGQRWSSSEQSALSTTAQHVRIRLAERNRQYEERFGFIYIVCATGKSADEMLAMAEERMHNSRDTELRVAAGEQGRITHLRLQKLLDVRV
ncbi:MAG: 2-oxo-4-hydroxy-4-carboxy-5-ureidoimidazoline decarboxylase [Gemmatimonadota bacterium]|nr:2-oxo-4-hydroxy-4-carboxy-5-ureidoimidazoline decarboxylase [Gemmatimonadota bacterium]